MEAAEFVLFRDSPAPTWVVAEDGTIVAANRAAESLVGRALAGTRAAEL